MVDPKTERNAVLEARKLGIPVFAIDDTVTQMKLIMLSQLMMMAFVLFV